MHSNNSRTSCSPEWWEAKAKFPPDICIFQIKEQDWGGGPDWKTRERRKLQGGDGRWSTRWTLTVHRTGQTDWWTGQFLALSAAWARVCQPHGALPGFSPGDIPTREAIHSLLEGSWGALGRRLRRMGGQARWNRDGRGHSCNPHLRGSNMSEQVTSKVA